MHFVVDFLMSLLLCESNSARLFSVMSRWFSPRLEGESRICYATLKAKSRTLGFLLARTF